VLKNGAYGLDVRPHRTLFTEPTKACGLTFQME